MRNDSFDGETIEVRGDAEIRKYYKDNLMNQGFNRLDKAKSSNITMFMKIAPIDGPRTHHMCFINYFRVRYKEN